MIMANNKYVAIFVPASVRAKIKQKAKENNRTIIGQLTEDYADKEAPHLPGTTGTGRDQAHTASH